MADRLTGVCKWFNEKKGFGFITRDDGKGDIFVHFTGIRGDKWKSLEEGAKVEFNEVEGNKGLKADDVTVIK